MDIDIADQADIDRRAFAIQLLGDARNIRRRRQLGVGQIESQRRGEQQRQFLVAERRIDADAIRHLEHEAHKSRLHRGAHPDRRARFRGHGGALLAQRALGGARPIRQLFQHLLRQTGRRALPAVGHQIDIEPLASGHGIDGDLALQSEANGAAIGIAARRADIVRHRIGDLIDRDIDRALEADHHHAARKQHFGIDVFVELDHQPGIAAFGRQHGLTAHRPVVLAGGRLQGAEQQRAGQQHHA